MALWQQGKGKGPLGPFGPGKGQPPAQAERMQCMAVHIDDKRNHIYIT